MRFLIAPLLLIAAGVSALGQPAMEGLSADPILPSLDRVLEIALQTSPSVKVQEALIEKNRYQLRRTRLEVFDAISGGVSTSYGSYGNAVLDEVTMGMQSNFSIRLSLFDILAGRTRRGVYRQELEVALEKRNEIEREEQRVVIALYNDLLLAGRLIRVKSEAMQAASVHRQMAEAEFARGDTPVSELARVTEIAAKAEAEYETARVAYVDAYAQLETLLGVALSSLQ